MSTAKPLFQAQDNSELFQLFFELMGPISGDIVKQIPNCQTSYLLNDKTLDTYVHKGFFRSRKQNIKTFF